MGLGSTMAVQKILYGVKAVPQMNKGAGGVYDTSFWDAPQWQQFGSKGKRWKYR